MSAFRYFRIEEDLGPRTETEIDREEAANLFTAMEGAGSISGDRGEREFNIGWSPYTLIVRVER